MLNISSGLIFKPFIHFQVSPVSEAEARRSYVMLNISSGLIFKPFIHFQVSPVSPAITSSTEDHDSSGRAPAPTVPDTEVSL